MNIQRINEPGQDSREIEIHVRGNAEVCVSGLLDIRRQVLI